MNNPPSFFNSLSLFVSRFFLELLSKNNPNVGLYFETDEEEFFLNRVRSFFNNTIPCGVFKNIPTQDQSFPQINNISYTVTTKELTIFAGATDKDKRLLQLKAKGELLERLATYVPLTLWKKKNFNKELLLKETMSPEWATSLLGFKSKRLKKSQVYWGMSHLTTSQATTTSGGAGHFSYTTAILNAWLELIERDSFLVYWLNTLSPKHIDISSCSKNSPQSYLQELLAMCKRYNLTYYFLDTTTDVAVPSCCCVLVSESPTGRRLALGASAGFGGEKVLEAAMSEAISVLRVHFFKEPYTITAPYQPFSNKEITREVRLRTYFTEEMFKHFSFFVASKEKVSFESWKAVPEYKDVSEITERQQLAHLKKVFKILAKEDPLYEVFYLPISNTLLKEFNYHVVRVFCDGLIPLYLNEAQAVPHHPRIKSFVKKMKLENVARLHPWPHPFP